MKQFVTTFGNLKKELIFNYDSSLPEGLLSSATTLASIKAVTEMNKDKDSYFIHPVHLEMEHLEIVIPQLLTHISAVEGGKYAYILVPSILRDNYIQQLSASVVTYFHQTNAFLMRMNLPAVDEVTLEEEVDDSYSILIKLGSLEIGRISHDNLLPSRLYDRIESDEEVALLEANDNPVTNKHLNYITIYDEYQLKGYFRQAMHLFQTMAKEESFETVNLVAEYSLEPIYNKLGYETVGDLPSIKSKLCSISLI